MKKLIKIISNWYQKKASKEIEGKDPNEIFDDAKKALGHLESKLGELALRGN